MSTGAQFLPESWWRKPSMLSLMGTAARLTLGAGRMNLTGRTPNGHEFIANPRQLWLVQNSHAIVRGVDAGPVGPLSEQARLRDFLIPQRGMFAVVRAFLESASSISSSQVLT